MIFHKMKILIAKNLQIIIDLETNSKFKRAYIRLRNDLLK